jgi:hypothetical protein
MPRLRVPAALVCAFCAAPAAALAQGGYSVVRRGAERPGSDAQGITTAEPVPPAPSAASTPGPRAEATELAVQRHPWDYAGVAPGTGGFAPGLHRFLLRHARRGGTPIVAWPGFQMLPGGSRLFLAVTGPVQVTTAQEAGRLIYRVHGARVVLHNNERPLETEAFDTPVERAFLRQRGRDVDLVVVLRNAATPQMSQQAGAGGLQFVFVDFPAWRPPNHVPLGMPGNRGNGARSLTEQGIRPADRPPPPGDTEEPPPVQPGQ